MRKQLILALSIVLVLSFAALALASQTFAVPARSQTTSTLTLVQGDQVTGNLNVTGGPNDDINFVITDPNGNPIQNYDHITQTPFSFQAQTSGNYTFTFDNSFSLLSSKSVTLDYTVQPATFGIPQDLLLPVIGAIAVVIIVVVVAVVLGSRRKAPVV